MPLPAVVPPIVLFVAPLVIDTAAPLLRIDCVPVMSVPTRLPSTRLPVEEVPTSRHAGDEDVGGPGGGAADRVVRAVDLDAAAVGAELDGAGDVEAGDVALDEVVRGIALEPDPVGGQHVPQRRDRAADRVVRPRDRDAAVGLAEDAVPEGFESIRLPTTRLSLVRSIAYVAPDSWLSTRLPAPATVPPIVLPADPFCSQSPNVPLDRTVVPAASVPMKFPSIRLPVAPE